MLLRSLMQTFLISTHFAKTEVNISIHSKTKGSAKRIDRTRNEANLNIVYMIGTQLKIKNFKVTIAVLNG